MGKKKPLFLPQVTTPNLGSGWQFYMYCDSNPNRPTPFEVNMEGTNLFMGVSYPSWLRHPKALLATLLSSSSSHFFTSNLQVLFENLTSATTDNRFSPMQRFVQVFQAILSTGSTFTAAESQSGRYLLGPLLECLLPWANNHICCRTDCLHSGLPPTQYH